MVVYPAHPAQMRRGSAGYGACGDRMLGSLLALVDCLRLRGAGLAAVGVPSSASLAFATIDPIRLFREARGFVFLLPAPFEEFASRPSFNARRQLSSQWKIPVPESNRRK